MTVPGGLQPGRRRSLQFFARVRSPDVLERVEFYADDLRILRSLGFDVRIATKFRQLRRADAYYIWWWTWAIVPVALAKLVGAPVVVMGVFDEWRYPERPWWHRLLIRGALSLASVNLFTSALETSAIGRWRGTRRPLYSPCAVDTDAYHPGVGARGAFLLSIATMDAGNSVRKCVAESIRAVALVRQAHPAVALRIVGYEGSDGPALRALVHELDLANHVRFIGVISREEKIALLQQCAVYLQPSRFEGFGLAILEAMSCATAVITSRVGAVPEVAGETVRYVDGTSPRSIAEAIESLIENDPARERLGRDARTRAAQLFSLEARSDRLRLLWGELLNAEG